MVKTLKVSHLTTNKLSMLNLIGYGGQVTLLTLTFTTNSSTSHLDSATTAFGRPSAPLNNSLADGVDGTDVTAGIKYAGYLDLFGDPETIDVSFLIVGSTRTAGGDLVTDHNTIVNELITLAESRKRLYSRCLT